MIELIKILLEKGYAYEMQGNVYYDISKFSDYTKLSGLKLDEEKAKARVDQDVLKKNYFDFSGSLSGKLKNAIISITNPTSIIKNPIPIITVTAPIRKIKPVIEIAIFNFILIENPSIRPFFEINFCQKKSPPIANGAIKRKKIK